LFEISDVIVGVLHTVLNSTADDVETQACDLYLRPDNLKV
jgi:hypothetical protein